MKVRLLAPFAFLASTYLPAQRPYTATQVLNYAKSVNVHDLDASLASRQLDDWLKNGPPHAHIQWELADSCDNKGDGNVDYPLCAKAYFSRNGEAGSVLIQVGTRRKGISEAPHLYNEVLGWEDGSLIMTGGAERLSGLPALLDQPAYAHGVGQLYEKIVVSHPVGIPTEATMARIRPFLSRRLTEELETAKSCEADYLRQQSSSATAQEPFWLKTGLFSGDGSRLRPASAWPVRGGPQKDGSFLVYVNLFAQSIDLGNGLKGGAYSAGGQWRVAVKVVSQDGKFVVDDVRTFAGDSTDGPSRLLSESFIGCDGPRWIGLNVAR